MAPGHRAKDLECPGATDPDSEGCVSLTEEKLKILKLSHVAIGSHPHDNDATKTVKVAKLLLCGESETIDANNVHSICGDP